MDILNKTLLALNYMLWIAVMFIRTDKERLVVILTALIVNVLSLKLIVFSWYYAKWTLLFSGFLGIAHFLKFWKYLLKE